MQIDNKKILAVVVTITLLLFPVVALTTGPLRIALGLPFVIFFPGYTLLSALFPKQDDLSNIERVALSFGLSIATVPLIGLALNYTPWGIRLYPILIAVTLFILAASVIAWYRLRALPPAQRFSFTLSPRVGNWLGTTRLDKTLSILLVLAILAAVGSLGYVIATPKQGEKFTEFYILNTEGKAEDYPQSVKLGKPVEVVIGVVNHEHQPVSYRVAIVIDDVIAKQVHTGTLAHEETWEEQVSFTARIAGEERRVEFYLYKNGEDEPYFEDPLHLYIDVHE